MNCPTCEKKLATKNLGNGLIWHCAGCNGTSIGTGLLQNLAKDDFLPKLWNQFRTEGKTSEKHCPACSKTMKELQAELAEVVLHLDACILCMLIWFDQGELNQIKLKAKELWPKDKVDYKAYRSFWSQPVPHQQLCMLFLINLP